MEHHFDVTYAAKYGIEEAIFINNLQFWIMKNKAAGKHLHEDRTWTYNSMDAFSKLFPYMTIARIRHTLNSLISQEVLITGNYNDKRYDRTLWYAFVDEETFINQQMHLSKMTNGIAENDRPIPYRNTDINNNTVLPEQEQATELSDADVKKKEKELLRDLKEKAKAEQKAKADSLWKLYIKLWEEFYFEKSKVKPVINGRECAALKGITTTLKKLTEENFGVWNEDAVKPMFLLFFESAYRKDDWLRKNFTLANINSQINQIIKIIVNGEPTNQPSSQVSKSTAGTIAHLEELHRKFEGS